MPGFEISSHAKAMLREREISEDWLWRTIQSADKSEKQATDNIWHYTKTITENDNRILHVVVNQDVVPYRVVTVFFDRRLRKRK